MVGLMHIRWRFILVLAGATVLCGCSDAFYRKWADQQVDHIVRERENQTLDYTPQVEAKTETPT